MPKAIIEYLSTILSLVAACIAVFGADYFSNLSADGRLAIYFIGFFAIIFFFENFFLRLVSRRRSRIVSALPLINEGFRKIHDAELNSGPDKAEIESALQKLCTNAASAFTAIIGSQCSVCIKIVTQAMSEEDGQGASVTTLCRDMHSETGRVSPKDIQFFVRENTAFFQIFSDMEQLAGPRFNSNNLPWLHDYQNKSFGYSKKLPAQGRLLRMIRWPLPYRSTIVVPICPCNPSKRSAGTLLGYFCVDNKWPYVFRFRDDIELMRGIADGLHPLLFKYGNIV